MIQNIKSKSSTEFDNISTQLMTNSMERIVSSMAEIFNSMIRSGIFPYDLKIAKAGLVLLHLFY